MRKTIAYLLYFLFDISFLKAQVGYDFLKWYGKAEYSQTGQINNYPSNFVLDSLNNGFACIPINGTAKIGDKIFKSSDGIGGLVLKYSNTGSLIWAQPIQGSNINFNKEGKLRNGQFVVTFYSGSKSIIGYDTFPVGNVIVAFDFSGRVDFAYAIPECAFSTFSSHLNHTLLTIKVINTGVYFGVNFTPGVYCVEITKYGALHSYTLIGRNVSSRITEIVTQTYDSLLFFTAYAKKGVPFIGKDYQVRAIDSNNHPGIYASDVFLSCVNRKGELKWIQRVDTMCAEPDIYSMALTRNGNIFWCPAYYKTGTILGKRAVVSFQGGRYSALSIIDAKNGFIKKLYGIDTVGGGNSNGAYLYEMSDKMSVVMKASGTESFKLWKGVPDSAKNLLQQTCIIRFDSEGDYYQFNELSLFQATPSVFNPSFASITGLFPNSGIANYKFSNIEIPNVMGNDYYFMCISIDPPTMSNTSRNMMGKANIYPNPTNQSFMVSDEKSRWTNASVFDAHGRSCGEIKPVNGHWEVGHLPAGLYLLQFLGENGHMASSRLLINR